MSRDASASHMRGFSRFARRMAKYVSVAAWSTFSDWVAFILLTMLGTGPLPAQGCARVVGGLVSFVANRTWTFEAKHTSRARVQGRRFLFLYAGSYVLSLSLMYVFFDVIGLSVYISKAGADGVCFIVNYFVMQTYVFHDRKGMTAWVRAWRSDRIDS